MLVLGSMVPNAQKVCSKTSEIHTERATNVEKRTTEPHNVLESTQYHRLSHLQVKKRSESSPNTNSYRQSTILECQQLVPKSDFESLLLGQNINFGSMCHAVLGCTRVT